MVSAHTKSFYPKASFRRSAVERNPQNFFLLGSFDCVTCDDMSNFLGLCTAVLISQGEKSTI